MRIGCYSMLWICHKTPSNAWRPQPNKQNPTHPEDCAGRHRCLMIYFFGDEPEVLDALLGALLGADAEAEAGAEAAGAAPGLPWPFTSSPACDSLTLFLSPIPLTRFCRSAQSLNSPPLVRSAMMALEIEGPMPLTPSSADWSALLTSTWANAMPIVRIKAKHANKSFLNMTSPLTKIRRRKVLPS